MLDPSREKRRPVVLAAALLLCAALTVLHQHGRRAGRSDAVSGLVRDAALVPAQTATERLGGWWRLHIAAVGDGPRLARENAALRQRVLALAAENKDLQAVRAENDRLRRLLRFERRSPRPLLAAEVVTLKPNPQVDTVTLNRGARDGVMPQETILAPNGALVGQVLDVSARASSGLLLTDSGSSVGAEVAARAPGQPAPVGIVQGDRQGHLFLTYLQSSVDVAPGAPVTTSGLGGVFPKGLPIGTVVSVKTDKARAVKTALLRPAADLDLLEEAFLLPKKADPMASGDRAGSDRSGRAGEAGSP